MARCADGEPPQSVAVWIGSAARSQGRFGPKLEEDVDPTALMERGGGGALTARLKELVSIARREDAENLLQPAQSHEGQDRGGRNGRVRGERLADRASCRESGQRLEFLVVPFAPGAPGGEVPRKLGEISGAIGKPDNRI